MGYYALCHPFLVDFFTNNQLYNEKNYVSIDLTPLDDWGE